MLKAVIFDFDGVITDSENLHFRAFNNVLASHNFQISKKDYFQDYLGLTDFDLLRTLAKSGVIKVDEQGIQELVKRKHIIFEKLAKTQGRIIEGVQEFLDLLGKNKIPMAICSGALQSEIELILEDGGLRGFFEIIVAADHVKRGKPYPDGFLLTLKRLNDKFHTAIRPNECIAVEDSMWGLKAAKSAGMHTIAVTNSYEACDLEMAEKIIANLKELDIATLQKLCS